MHKGDDGKEFGGDLSASTIKLLPRCGGGGDDAAVKQTPDTATRSAGGLRSGWLVTGALFETDALRRPILGPGLRFPLLLGGGSIGPLLCTVLKQAEVVLLRLAAEADLKKGITLDAGFWSTFFIVKASGPISGPPSNLFAALAGEVDLC